MTQGRKDDSFRDSVRFANETSTIFSSKKAKTTTLPKPNVRNDTGLLEDTIITKSITNKKKKQSTTASASTESTSFMRPFTSNVQNKQKRTLRQGEKVAGGVT